MKWCRPSSTIAVMATVGMVTAGLAGTAAADQSIQQAGMAASAEGSEALAADAVQTYSASRIEAPDPQPDGRWAERLTVAPSGGGDIDGDGVTDLFVGQPSYSSSAGDDTGRVWLVSGKTREVIYSIDPPEPQPGAKFGFFVSALGDVDGDGMTDIAVGTDSQDVGGHEDQGAAWVFSGADASPLYRLANPKPQADGRFGSRIGRAGDVTRDGIPDVIVGASSNDSPTGCGQRSPQPGGCHVNQGEAFIFDGQDGSLVRRLKLPGRDRPRPTCTEEGDCGSFGIAVQGPGDTNGDGITDQLVGASSLDDGRGKMYVFSGKTGRLLHSIGVPSGQEGAFFGFQDVAPLTPGDVNGDGFADLYGNGFLQDGPAGEAEGKAWVFDGRTGEVLYRLDDPTPTAGGQFGWSAAKTDYNGDGTPDIYVGQSPHHVAGTPQNGGTYVFDGADGSLLQTLEVPPADRDPADNPRLGWAIAAPGDLNGDGQPDYVGGAPFADVGGTTDQGVLYVFLSGGA